MTINEIEEKGGESWSKVHQLSEQIRTRVEGKKADISYHHCRKHELRYLSLEEWRVLVLSYFLSCCSNSGDLRCNLESGLAVLPHIRAVGLNGCADVLERLVALEDEFDAYRELVDKGKITAEQFDGLVIEWDSRVERLEATAEGDDKAMEILWEYALQNKDAFS